MIYRWNEVGEHLTQPFKELLRKEEDYLIVAVRDRNWDVLEIGCGTGRLLTKLSPHVRRIEGIEHEYSQVEIARQHVKNLQNVRVRYCDGISMPEDLFGAFDLSFSVENTPGNQGYDKFAFLKGIGKTVKPDGTIILSVYAENALDYQIELYHQLDYETQVIDDYVLAKNPEGKSWVSERFSKDKLASLFLDNGFTNFNIEKLTSFSYICTLKN